MPAYASCSVVVSAVGGVPRDAGAPSVCHLREAVATAECGRCTALPLGVVGAARAPVVGVALGERAASEWNGGRWDPCRGVAHSLGGVARSVT